MLSLGTRTLLKKSSETMLPRMPIISSIFPTWKPGIDFSMMKMAMPRAFFAGSSVAATRKRSPTPPLVTKAFWPLMMKESPSGAAVVWMEAASDPACGSVTVKPPIFRPLARSGTKRSIWAGVPNFRRGARHTELCTVTPRPTAALTREISSMAMA